MDKYIGRDVHKFCEFGGLAGPVAELRSTYEQFISRKRRRAEQYGFDVDESELNPRLFGWQKRIVKWALSRGRAALFEECGLGKTVQQLVWAEQVHRRENGPVMIHTPVGVRSQTRDEAAKFGIGCRVEVINDQSEIVDGINLVNYEKLHKFDCRQFVGVVLDESSILKGQTSKTRAALKDAWEHARYRLACTATPAPNDHTELGNHADFLGICEPSDMLNRFFVHDSGETQTWRLRGHAERDFWQWVASWAVCISKPSDIGGDDDGFALPPLITERHFVHVDEHESPPGMLFNTAGLTATTVHEEKRLTSPARCKRAAEIVNQHDTACIVWCDTNYDADMLQTLLPDTVEVRGADSEIEKERKLQQFSTGHERVLITKPSIAGFGMNWQHCNRMVFSGLSYSFEQYYQAVRRCWRFGQSKPVHVDIVVADSESAIQSAVARKESDFDAMRCGMADAMHHATMLEFGLDNHKQLYRRASSITLPKWMKG